MNRSINPKIIGLFVTAAIAVFVMLVLFLGSARLFSQSVRYILFFEHSVNGLDVGSLVKYKGVPIGVVERILIRVEGQSQDSTSIPVIVRIDRSRLTNRLGTSVKVFDPKFIYEMIENGLVAQLEMESYITGQLFVEFSLQPDQVNDFESHRSGDYGMIEIPTLSSSFYEITEDVGSLISSFAELDFARTFQSTNLVLENLASVLQKLDTKELSRAVVDLSDQITLLLGSEEFRTTLLSLRSALEQFETTVSTYELQDGQIAEAVDRLNQTLAGLDQLVEVGNEMLAPESTTRYELENSLRELGRAAQSLRFFIEYLERNPNALLTGRAETTE